MAVLAQSRSPNVPSSRQRAELVLGQLDHLPALPALATRLLAVTTSSRSSARDVVELIEADASMTAAVLRRVQRADLGIRPNTMTVERAVTLLGFSTVRNLVFSLQLYGSFKGTGLDAAAHTTFRELWRHNLAVACASELIAGYVAPGIQGDAFVCGLLHDIGKIALDVCLPKSFGRVVRTAELRALCICDVERDALGLDHTVAGKQIGMRWGLPQAVIDCIWLHHQDVSALPSGLMSPQLVRIVHLADDLVRREGIGFSGYLHVGNIEEQARSLKLSHPRLEKVVYQLPNRMRPICDMIELDEPVDMSATTAVLTTANLQLSQLNDKITEANRRLVVRSAILSAVEDFSNRLGGCDRATDVCKAAAQCTRALLSSEEALAFFHDTSTGCILAASSDGPPRVESLSMFDPDHSDGNGNDLPLLTTIAANMLSRASDELCAFWQRYVRKVSSESLYVLPLIVRDHVVGAVLVAVSEEKLLRFRRARTECHILATALGLALLSAGERANAERTSEDFAELNRRVHAMQEERVRNRSVSMISAMAAGAAHELNNPLAVISGRAQMGLGEGDKDELQTSLRTIVEQTELATGIVNELVAFAKPDPPNPVLQRLADVIDPLCQRWKTRSDSQSAEIAASVVDEESTVYVDPIHLRTVLDAVVKNATEARGDRPLRVQINSPSCVSDETVRIVVRDNGAGMTRDVLEHAIDPFFSCRPSGRGRGMGLSHAYRLVEINGGRLWIDSKPDHGTTVLIELPARAPAKKNADAGEQLQDSLG